MSTIVTRNITYYEPEIGEINDFSYTFEGNKIIGLIAPIEERVSVLLRIMAGIKEPSSGRVLLDNVDIHQANTSVIKDIRKKMAFVFDRGGIISNLSILENLFLPLNFHYPEWPKGEKLDLIKYYFDKFHISEKYLSMRPANIHPQIAKLVNIIRAYLIRPEIILYDNPLGDLELRMRKEVFKHITELRERNNVLQIFVSTSDILFDVADNNIVFGDGRMIEEGCWEELILSESVITQKIVKEYLEVGLNEA
ncbi:MAG: ATP-binding cassette domain-containing protein [Ignavibacteria bacterium]|nr:ATP-binding cassette domain-containing protein [Ignavibacteria bacterium]